MTKQRRIKCCLKVDSAHILVMKYWSVWHPVWSVQKKGVWVLTEVIFHKLTLLGQIGFGQSQVTGYEVFRLNAKMWEGYWTWIRHLNWEINFVGVEFSLKWKRGWVREVDKRGREDPVANDKCTAYNQISMKHIQLDSFYSSCSAAASIVSPLWDGHCQMKHYHFLRLIENHICA